MARKRKPQARRARRPGAGKTRSRHNQSIPQSGRTGKRRSIPLSQLPERSYAARDRGFHVLAAMRHDPRLSLTHAAKLQGVRPETVKKYFAAALNKSNGKFWATKSDRYTATLYIPDENGNPVPVRTHSSKDREAVGQYLRDLGRYLRGDRNALSAWHGKEIAGAKLVTDLSTILAIEPALSDFSLYRVFQGGGA